MQIRNKFGKKYISEVKRRLKCAGKLRRGYLAVLKGELYNFELDHPDADYTNYTAEFGTPENVAEAYLGELSRRERAAYWFPLAAVLGAVAVSAFLFLFALVMTLRDLNGGYMTQSAAKVISASDSFEYD